MHGILVFLNNGQGKIVSLTNSIHNKKLKYSGEETVLFAGDVSSPSHHRKQRKKGKTKCLDEWPPMRPFQGECSWSEDEISDTIIDSTQENDKENDNPNKKEYDNISYPLSDVGNASNSIQRTRKILNENNAATDNPILVPNKKQRTSIANYSTNEKSQTLIFEEQIPAEISDISVCSDDKLDKAISIDQKSIDDQFNSDVSFQEDTSLVSRLKMAVWKVFNID